LNYKDQRTPALALLARFGNPYLHSAVDADGRIGMDLGVQGVPETFVIDAAGRVRYRHLGPVNNEVWESKLMPVVKALR
jgi:cytochrome c biogenesis protein CcmG/thiol:disulfide interchange protein DsbE